MTIHTDISVSQAFRACYNALWTPGHEQRLANAMLRAERAAGHRKGFPAAPQTQNRRCTITPMGELARKMAEQGADDLAIVAATGLSIGHVQRMIRDITGVVSKRLSSTAGPTPDGRKAREMAAAGEGVDAILAATDLSRRTVLRIVREAREAAA